MNDFLKKASSLFIFVMLLMSGFALTSCGDDPDDSDTTTNVTASDLNGHGFSASNPMTITGYDADDFNETLYFNTSSTVNWQWTYENEFGVSADGNYVVSGNVITITFSNLRVTGLSNSKTFGGFTNGQSYTLRYTINNYKYPDLTVTSSKGGKQYFVAYR